MNERSFRSVFLERGGGGGAAVAGVRNLIKGRVNSGHQRKTNKCILVHNQQSKAQSEGLSLPLKLPQEEQ